MGEFDPKTFVEVHIKEIREVVGNQKALVAVSGGVDSSTCAVLTHLAIGGNLICVIIDDAFMREGEPERVAKVLSNPLLNLPMKIERAQERFLEALKGLRDAEEKRKAFRETFYKTLSEIAKREGSRYLVQGTILADVLETKGGIKTQHNVLEQIGISTRELYGFKVVEPLVTLLKWQVREVARHLKIPPELSERQPFPGPGLSVRVVGEIRSDKLDSLKIATRITETNLAKHGPSQYYAAIIDNEGKNAHPDLKKIEETTVKSLGISSKRVSSKIFGNKATGIKGDARKYGEIVAMICREDSGELYQPDLDQLIEMQKNVIAENESVTRILYAVSEKDGAQPYVIAMRAVETRDFLTARVADIPWETLKETANRILEKCVNVSTVYYDVTPKPPATIEME
jgi:GMP synthase (glutamine-hydrolysing)